MATKEFGKRGWTPERLGNLSGKTYVITGANAGAGYQAAKILLSKGAAVVMLNRNKKNLIKPLMTLRNNLVKMLKFHL